MTDPREKLVRAIECLAGYHFKPSSLIEAERLLREILAEVDAVREMLPSELSPEKRHQAAENHQIALLCEVTTLSLGRER